MTPLDTAGFLRTPTARHFPTLRKSFHLDVQDVQEQVRLCFICLLVSFVGDGVDDGIDYDHPWW